MRSKSAFLARDGDREAGVRAFLAGDPDDERLNGLRCEGGGCEARRRNLGSRLAHDLGSRRGRAHDPILANDNLAGRS